MQTFKSRGLPSRLSCISSAGISFFQAQWPLTFQWDSAGTRWHPDCHNTWLSRFNKPPNARRSGKVKSVKSVWRHSYRYFILWHCRFRYRWSVRTNWRLLRTNRKWIPHSSNIRKSAWHSKERLQTQIKILPVVDVTLENVWFTNSIYSCRISVSALYKFHWVLYKYHAVSCMPYLCSYSTGDCVGFLPSNAWTITQF